MSDLSYQPLRVESVHHELGGQAVSIAFEPCDYTWVAGQHLPIRLQVNGAEVRRQYSISVPPSDDRLRITVKRVEGGVVSNHLNDTAQVGDTIDAAPPQGRFVLEPDQRARRTYYFLGAGSGITPLFSMLASVVDSEPDSVVHLCYGNHSAETILLRDDLEGLATRAGERMSLSHIFSQPERGSQVKPWRTGRVDREALVALFRERPPYAQDTHYFICGPNAMNAGVRDALVSLDVPASRIHSESFGGVAVEDSPMTGQAARLEIVMDGDHQVVDVAADQTLLGAILAAGIDAPYSCSSGVCGTCVAQLREGEVQMRSRMALDDAEVREGRVLTCQALAKSDQLALNYD